MDVMEFQKPKRLCTEFNPFKGKSILTKVLDERPLTLIRPEDIKKEPDEDLLAVCSQLDNKNIQTPATGASNLNEEFVMIYMPVLVKDGVISKVGSLQPLPAGRYAKVNCKSISVKPDNIIHRQPICIKTVFPVSSITKKSNSGMNDSRFIVMENEQGSKTSTDVTRQITCDERGLVTFETPETSSSGIRPIIKTGNRSFIHKPPREIRPQPETGNLSLIHKTRTKIRPSVCKRTVRPNPLGDISNNSTSRPFSPVSSEPCAVMYSTEKFQCFIDHCNYDFAMYEEYKIHMKQIHKRHTCSFCSSTFVSKSNLSRHERFHRIGKTEQCLVCLKYFARSDGLKEHRLIHTKSYQTMTCVVCLRSFIRKSDILKHLKLCFTEDTFQTDLDENQVVENSCVVSDASVSSRPLATTSCSVTPEKTPSMREQETDQNQTKESESLSSSESDYIGKEKERLQSVEAYIDRLIQNDSMVTHSDQSEDEALIIDLDEIKKFERAPSADL